MDQAAYLRAYKEKMVKAGLHLLKSRGFFQCMCCARKWIPEAEAAWPNPVRIWEPRNGRRTVNDEIPLYLVCKACDQAMTPKQKYEAVGDNLKALGKIMEPGMVPQKLREQLGMKPE